MLFFIKADHEITDPAVAAELKKRRTFRTFSYRGVELDKLLDLSNTTLQAVRSRFYESCSQLEHFFNPALVIK